MSEPYIAYLAVGMLGFRVLGGVITILGSSWSDAKNLLRQRNNKLNKGHNKDKRTKKLSVLVMVLAENQASTIAGSLDHIMSNAKHSYKVLVIDNASTDDTSQILKHYIKNRRRKLSLLTKRKKTSPLVLIQDGLKKSKTSDIVVVLDGRSVLDQDSIQKLTERFKGDEQLGTVTLKQQLRPYPSILALLQRFETLAASFMYKTLLLHKTHPNGVSGLIAAYRREALVKTKKRAPVQTFRSSYASDLLILRQPLDSYRAWFRQLKAQAANQLGPTGSWKRHMPFTKPSILRTAVSRINNLLIIFEPFMLAYFAYLAFSGQEKALFLISWASLVVWFALVIWSDESLGFGQKLRLSGYLPILYVLFFVLRAFQAILLLSHPFLRRKPPHKSQAQLKSLKKLVTAKT